MGRFRRFDIVEYTAPSYFLQETSIFSPPRSPLLNPWFPSFSALEEELDHTFELLNSSSPPPLLFDEFSSVTDLIQIDQKPFRTSTRRLIRREPYLQTFSDRISALELGLERLLREEKSRKNKSEERKYTWTAEIKSLEDDRKYKWTTEKKGSEKSYELKAEIKRKGTEKLPIEQTYTIKVSSGSSGNKSVEKKKKSEKVKEKGRVVEIEEPSDHGGLVLRQAFAKRVDKRRGKRKELSPQDAATLIQKSFRAHLIRRSQALRALRELAIAKTKLKEIRALFNNFSYRTRLSHSAEERQRFSEKIIVLLLTIDAIEGADVMVRSAKKSMVDELEAMLDVVDPQPHGKSSLMRRRTFDMPDGVISKELAAGVAQVVRMLDQEATSSEAFEACL
ncbi:hypothetical protein ACS0TY_001261 [Phlomoides rotata]